MGSKDQRHSRVDIFHQAYVGPLEAVPWATTFLEEQTRSLVVQRRQPAKMATHSHTGGEMPLEQLLVLYGYNLSDPVLKQQQDPYELAASFPDIALDKVQIGKDLLSRGRDVDKNHPMSDDLTFSVTSHNSDLLHHHLRGDDKDTSVSSSEDDSESNSSDGRKDIMVGSQYQAVIPSFCSSNNYNEGGYEYEDQLLWTPDVLSNPTVEEFLLEVQRRGSDNGATNTLTTGDIVKDNEQALYELVKCNFNAEESLRRFRYNVKVFSEELCGWNEEECRSFEYGYRAHGKNFHLIQANKVRTRSVGECVEYYYMWKKSERHEYFTQQATKLSRKKCNMPSGNIEDAEPDGDIEVEGATQGLPSKSSVQLHPPSASDVMDLDKQGSERHVGWTELCPDSGCSPKGERLFSQFLLPLQFFQTSVKDRAGKTSPSAQLYLPPVPSSHIEGSSQPISGLPGAGVYKMQLGFFSEDLVPAF
ncbi:Mesoderm induction early response protein 2 [Triplophysa tibetana]|uniref:Mesoderm induction early response protein 2 n=1 Tax=Triplophysa tibetana TaxID=1572043 RepID=A0A5A9NVB5_9TELE|nr:Mesoderm induction early response protein 2 [Triplophysa tibetana]